jgi:pimeloyl-ACP methyl ester carboxylesterase
MRHRLHHGVFVREFGREDGPRTVLWIHGLGESGLCFESLLDRPDLADWRHLVPDFPGYGRTAWPGAPLPLAEQADLAADLCGDLAGGPVVVAGHSMGGVTALLMAERHRALVRGVVDIDGNKSVDDCRFSGLAAAMPLDRFMHGGFDDMRATIFAGGGDDAALRGYYASLRLADPATYHANSVELLEMSTPRADLARRLRALACPRVYIAGTPGGVSRLSRGILDEERLPVIDIAPSGHWPFIDRPDAFTGALREFLDEVG